MKFLLILMMSMTASYAQEFPQELNNTMWYVDYDDTSNWRYHGRFVLLFNNEGKVQCITQSNSRSPNDIRVSGLTNTNVSEHEEGINLVPGCYGWNFLWQDETLTPRVTNSNIKILKAEKVSLIPSHIMPNAQSIQGNYFSLQFLS